MKSPALHRLQRPCPRRGHSPRRRRALLSWHRIRLPRWIPRQCQTRLCPRLPPGRARGKSHRALGRLRVGMEAGGSVSPEHFFSFDRCWCQNRRIAWQTPSTPSPLPWPPSTHSPWPPLPTPSPYSDHRPQENRHAVEQLERCVLSPAIRFPCTCRAARMGEWAKRYYLDDQRRLCCALPCATRHCPYNSACGRLIDVSRSLSDDTHSSHYCSRCYVRYERYWHGYCLLQALLAFTKRRFFRRRGLKP